MSNFGRMFMLKKVGTMTNRPEGIGSRGGRRGVGTRGPQPKSFLEQQNRAFSKNWTPGQGPKWVRSQKILIF